MLARFIVGDGFENDALNLAVASDNLFGKVTMYKLHSQIAKTISRQNAAALAIQYDGNYDVSAVTHIPYRDIRFGTRDSRGYTGLIHYYSNWHRDPSMTYREADIARINAYNSNPDVIAAQWEAKGRNYRGQIAVLRMDDEYIYPLAPIDPALEDADTEAQIKMFKNGELNKGFFAKYILFHSRFQNEEEQRNFKEIMRRFEGGDHDSSILMAEAEFDTNGEMLEGSSFKLEKIEQNINDKIFESFERTVSNNIRKALYSIPSILIEQQDAGFFGQSGEAITQAFNFYNTQTEDLRYSLSQWYQDIFSRSANPVLRGADFTIKKLNYGTVNTI